MIKILFKNGTNKFLEFNKFYNILVEFNRKIPFFTKKEYEKTKDDAHDKIQIIPNILKQINISFNEIQEHSSELNIQTIQKLDILQSKRITTSSLNRILISTNSHDNVIINEIRF